MISICQRRRRRIIPALVGVVLLLATATRAQKVAPEKIPATSPANTITGRVVIQGGETAHGAIATAFPVGIAAQGRSTAVDSSGSFKFDGLEAGVYSVSAYLPGFVPPPPASPEESRRFYHTGDSVNLTLMKGGVITGTVTTVTSGPVVAAAVRAIRIKDVNGQPEPAVVQVRERQTDDRGYYRFYGLPPGMYVISAGGQGRTYAGNPPGAYDNDIPTYAPSSTRETAMEVVVRSGEEITADIQYRGETGQIISGTLGGLIQSTSLGMVNANGAVTLTDVRNRAILMSVGTSSLSNSAFAFYGVPDGEYELLAQQFLPSRDILRSEPRRVKVQGASISGINLSLAPLGSIAGRLVLESNPPAHCVIGRESASQETVIVARRLKPETKPPAGKTAKPETPAEIPLSSTMIMRADSVPDAKGDFLLSNLDIGLYHVDTELPGPGWYLRSIAIGTQPIPIKPSGPNISRDGLTLKSGERLSGLTITITEGAASLRGHVSVAEGQVLPARLRVYLAPAESESAENVLRFFEARADSDGSFFVRNIAPGRYWIIASPDDESDPATAKSIRQDSALRVKVLRQGEGLKKEISLKPCERTTDYDLRYLPQPPPGQ
jgi:hypothetical protein